MARANLLEIAPFKSADRYLRYLDALDAENEGELDSALDIYVSLGSFEDCAERAQTLEAAIPEQAIRQGRQMMSQGDYEGARDLDSLLQYVNQMTGMQRLKTGDVDPSYGRIPVIDSLLASFKQYDESSLNELDKALESVSEAIPSRRVYMLSLIHI